MGTSATGRVDRTISIVSLAVAALSLLISVVVIFNGSSRQATFESNRQLCIDGLTRFARTLTEIQLTQGNLSSTQGADLVVDAARVELTCFDTKILDKESQFFADWKTYLGVLNTHLAFRSDNEDDLSVINNEIARDLLRQQMVAISDAMDVAVSNPGPGFLPMQDAVPTAPATFPPLGTPTPDATP